MFKNKWKIQETSYKTRMADIVIINILKTLKNI